MTDEERQQIFAGLGAVIVKLKNAESLNQGVELTADEVKGFMAVTKAGTDNLLPSQASPFKLALDDFPETFGDDEEKSLPDFEMLPIAINPFQQPQLDGLTMETTFDFISGKTLDEFKANVNALLNDKGVSFNFTSDLKKNVGIGYYQPILITRYEKL